MRVGNQPETDTRSGKRPEHGGDFLVQLEVLARSPLRVDFARTRIDARAAPPHLFDNVPRVGDEDLRVVGRVLGPVEQRCRADDRPLEFRFVDLDAVARTERSIPFAAKHRPWINEREVDVEKYGLGRHE